MSDNISVGSESGAELVISPSTTREITEVDFSNQLSGISSDWRDAILLPTWIDDSPERDEAPPVDIESSGAGSGTDTQSNQVQDDEMDSDGEREEKSDSDCESYELASDRPLQGGSVDEMREHITSLEREKREIEAGAEDRVKRYQRESEELQLALSAQRTENEQRYKMSQLSETDLISMVQRKDREIGFLSEEIEKYTKRLSELSAAKLSEQSQLERALKEDERLRVRESVIQHQKEYSVKKCDWLEEELTQKSKDAIQMKSRLQEQISDLEEDNKRNLKQLEAARNELKEEADEKEKLREKLDSCLSELERSRDELCSNEDRHRQEVTGQKKLATLYKESAEQSELKVHATICSIFFDIGIHEFSAGQNQYRLVSRIMGV